MSFRFISGFVLSVAILMFFTVSASAQVSESMLQKARAAGMTQDQIDAAVAAQGNDGTLDGSNKNGKNSTNNKQSTTSGSSLYPNMLSGRDTSSRRVLTIEELESINPSLLEKVISDKIDKEYQTDPEKQKSIKRQTYSSEIEEYEIVIKEGEFIKRPLPVVFGREMFSNKNLTFEPSYTIATPQNYILGPGDEVKVEVWGTSELYALEKISPDGSIYINGIGPIHLSGLTIGDAQKRVGTKVSQAMSGADVSISLGRIRSIKVNIAGEAAVPGSYTLPSLATVFNALYSAGGVNKIGSLRSIKVYRDSKLVADLDIYDYLIHGKYDTNIRLQDNDMIIVSAYDSYVTAYGEVKRPRVYEMKKNETLKQLIEYAGDFKGEAYRENIQVKRKTGRQYKISTVDNADFDAFTLNDGDSVSIGKIFNEYANRAVITGAVWRPGEYEISDDVKTLSSLIAKAEGLKGNEFGSRGQIIRRKRDYTKEVVPFNVLDVARGSYNIDLVAEDSVFIPTVMELREDYTIKVEGEVNKADTLDYRDGMTIEDAILMSGGLKESASLARIEIARRIKDPNSTTYTNSTAELYTFNISGDLKVAPEANRFILHPFDEVYVRRSPGYSEQQRVTVNGEVLYAGVYVMGKSGERISDIIKKAGGVTPEGYVKGASIKRLLSDDEKAKLESIMKILQSSSKNDSLSVTSFDFSEYYPIGVDFVVALANPGGMDDIILQDGDILTIPKLNNTVKISGSVLYPNSVTFNSRNNKIRDYVSQAGGYSSIASKRPFVIYMNGKVASASAGRNPKIEPGCEIVVPMKKAKSGEGLATTMGILSSSTSMAAMMVTLLNNMR